MNRRIQEIFTAAEGRYLTQEEQDYISQAAASVAVSYTHLDVYKRQTSRPAAVWIL